MQGHDVKKLGRMSMYEVYRGKIYNIPILLLLIKAVDGVVSASTVPVPYHTIPAKTAASGHKQLATIFK